MAAPIARAPRRAAREDDSARLSVRDLSPLPRARLRARATSNHPAHGGGSGVHGPIRFGPYVVHELLGEGGMASVHRAERIGADGVRQPIALKRMWTELAEDRAFVEAFVQEARLASLLRHDNIARAHELGRLGGTYYIAMELVTGPTLQQVMAQCRTAAGAMPLPIIVEILLQLCDALDHAHNLRDEHGRPLGIIHRDVSPANVMLARTGTVKLIDFGISKAARARAQTEAGFIKGKLSYVAPEYTFGLLDARADLFAVGVIAHELIAGDRLFLADSDLETVGNVRDKPIQPPSRYDPRVPRELDDIVLTALQRDPDRRWQSAAAMRTALTALARDLGPVSRDELRAWVAWAFACEPRRDSMVVRLLDTWEPTRAVAAPTPAPAREVISVPAPVPPPVPAAAGRAARGPLAATTELDARPSQVMPGLVVLLLVALGLAAAAWQGWLERVVAQV